MGAPRVACIAGHSLRRLTLEHAAAILDRATEDIVRVCRCVGASNNPKWEVVSPAAGTTLQSMAEDETASLAGPYGLEMTIGSHCIALYSGTTWHEFLTELDVREGFRAMCRCIAKRLKLVELLYLPSDKEGVSIALDWVWDGKTYREIQERMRERFGPPAERIEDICRVRSHEEREIAARRFLEDHPHTSLTQEEAEDLVFETENGYFVERSE